MDIEGILEDERYEIKPWDNMRDWKITENMMLMMIMVCTISAVVLLFTLGPALQDAAISNRVNTQVERAASIYTAID